MLINSSSDSVLSSTCIYPFTCWCLKVSEAPQIQHVQKLTNHFIPETLFSRVPYLIAWHFCPVVQVISLGITSQPPSPSPSMYDQSVLHRVRPLASLLEVSPNLSTLSNHTVIGGGRPASSSQSCYRKRHKGHFSYSSFSKMQANLPPSANMVTFHRVYTFLWVPITLTSFRKLTQLPLVFSHHCLHQASLWLRSNLLSWSLFFKISLFFSLPLNLCTC